MTRDWPDFLLVLALIPASLTYALASHRADRRANVAAIREARR
jgi:hypothetical protein